MEIVFDKLYKNIRKEEPCYIGIPFAKGKLKDIDGLHLYQDTVAGTVELTLQKKVTSSYDDGSVRFLFLRFMPDLPGNKGEVLRLATSDAEREKDAKPKDTGSASVSVTTDGLQVNTGKLAYETTTGNGVFKYIKIGERIYQKEQFIGPYLKEKGGRCYETKINDWKIIEEGPVAAIIAATGSNIAADGKHIDFEIRLTAYANKPWVEFSYRIINTSDDELLIDSLVFEIRRNAEKLMPDDSISTMPIKEVLDSTGCGDVFTDEEKTDGPIAHVRGDKDTKPFDNWSEISGVRTIAGSSNYKTNFYIGTDGYEVNQTVDGRQLMTEGNEHLAEVFYGTFFADCTDENGGICVTVFQAQQNYPKAVRADEKGVAVFIVPSADYGEFTQVVMQPGMAREQRFLMHFHDRELPIEEINNRGLIYQMPDRPHISSQVHQESEVWPEVFPSHRLSNVELKLLEWADEHGKIHGMMNFGDTCDLGYTRQGRGGGEPVFSNNEYDFPHAMAIEYARTGMRRCLDYVCAAVSHWMDVDVCHYHKDPMYIGGQWEHTNGHCKHGIMVCSHQWVEGLLDYYHFTGDERAYETAIGIGNNILGLLKLPMYQVPGEANARETGWALRSLTALYVETGDEKWIEPSERIIEDFKIWEKKSGGWLSPYTDNTEIRVPFMIAIACGSLMRYYRVFPRDDIKDMLIRAVDDLIENAYIKELDAFYYKELPSINRVTMNILVLEALTIAYELTGDSNYLKPGLNMFDMKLKSSGGFSQSKRIEGDGLYVGNAGTKNFAQSFIPMSTYYTACVETGLM